MAGPKVQQAVHYGSPEPDSVRDIDPNVLQRKASNPAVSVWVGASAGTGKTKVLTDRVLRLMLPRTDGQKATPPHKILGITFTKAGASEMALRINKMLGEWAVLPSETLATELQDLLGQPPTPEQTAAARRLFADVVDTPGGLKIMTIHSFCQSVLSRFPLEAGLPPYFTGLEETESAALLKTASDRVIKALESDPASLESTAFRRIAETINAEQFFGLARAMASERRQLRDLIAQHFGLEGLYTNLCSKLGVKPGIEPQQIKLEACADRSFDKTGLQKACKALALSKNKSDQESAAILGDWLEATSLERAAIFEKYQNLYFTKEGELRKKLATDTAVKSAPEILSILDREATRLLALREEINAASCALLTRDLLRLGQAIIDEFQNIKTARAALDYDDLIFTTLDLLEGRTNTLGADKATGWVLYKLDRGLDHILIDEAQDTNPEQWKIIEALCADFFAGAGASTETRTIFTVGDEKQSIYSFQRASPEEFARMRADFKARVRNAGQIWDDLPLNISFRSTQSVLKAVDAVFAAPAARKGLGLAKIDHISYRRGQAGRVEIWPLCEAPERPETDPWQPPLDIRQTSSAPALLAAQIATAIRGWLDKGEILPSHGRPIKPGDIMILVRTRTAFVGQLTKALKDLDIPVSGVDRMIPGQQLPVMDLMAMAEYALLPVDDLTLACVLKSPLLGLDEDTLFDLAAKRGETSLWQALQASTRHKDIGSYLNNLITRAADAHPYEFFSHILQTPCPGDAISGARAIRGRLGDDAMDPIDELLNAALTFERNNIPSLQGFLHTQRNAETQVKRELGEAGSEVRIMTVHGAKGLQAPIVILPDTTQARRKSPDKPDKRLLWPDKTGMGLPLWAPRQVYECQAYTDSLAVLDERMEEESRRLLYVAMTRAEDRLYITGYKSGKNIDPTSWYNYIAPALESISEIERLEDGILRLDNPQISDSDKTKEQKIPIGRFETLPDWLYKPAPEEPDPPAPLVPSRPSESDQTVFSPLHIADIYRFRRGNLTHKLLEILPLLSPDRHTQAAQDYIRRTGSDLKEDIRQDIVRETLAILAHPEFAAIFGTGSLAEVPVTGLMDGRLVSGQIDRLLVTKKDILIIDYKTNRPPPRHVHDVSPLYLRQMQAYAATLRAIYPGRTVRAALLWTDGPRLMPLPPESV